MVSHADYFPDLLSLTPIRAVCVTQLSPSTDISEVKQGRKNRGLACEASGHRRLSGGSDLRPPTMVGEVAWTTEKYCHDKTGSTISRELVAV